ncbi:hypothetical protein GCM10009069_11640 [Algimonas arctica]|uniref:Alginate lyase n=1 Tax=Algimonas arctica TaxID=1479486 RepID=A0A8J3CRW7_9PROT|nr:polysaccharide lyase 6 family protein [Algimonas arctica]GHA90140.1 hypothetical protein GCM10009069_11640 [Algimonas arctica]
MSQGNYRQLQMRDQYDRNSLTGLNRKWGALTSGIVAAFVLAPSLAVAADILVHSQDEYEDAVDDAVPGDTVLLANGSWDDFEIVFTGEGKADKPITLTAQTKGEVFLTGQSNLRLGGNHLVVSGLVFKDGYTPTRDVISFRRTKQHLANHSRVTEIVIDNFNQPERYDVDFWVMMYGQNNRFDHNHLVGKRNKGVTMAVRLDTKASQENRHRIDHNYFGPRPVLGSNGGETLRIGTSKYSLSDSLTLVENNYFDRCDGEVEIISNKSGKNVFRNNTFDRSKGTLTLRHGNGNRVEGNVFFGHGVDHTGGIRVINADQTVQNNYMEGLTGTRFGGGLTVMNGVPDSPINRYHQVKNARIENNTVVNVDNVQFGAGSDDERSAVPQDSTMSHNLFVHTAAGQIFTVYDDMSGIAFDGNVVSGFPAPDFTDGFQKYDIRLARAENGLLYPVGLPDVGIRRDLKVTTKDMTGVSWFPKNEPIVPFGSGKTIKIDGGDGALFDAIQDADPGDIIHLKADDYNAPMFLSIDKPITIRGVGDVAFTFERSALFEILEGGSLRLENVKISGSEAPDNVGNTVIRTSPSSMLVNYRVEIVDSEFSDLNANRDFNVIKGSKGTFADHILIQNSKFSNVSGSVIRLTEEIDDKGIYGAEYITVENSSLTNIDGPVFDIYRGGKDESTFGPHVGLLTSTITDSGRGKGNEANAMLRLHGVQVTDVEDTVFRNSGAILIKHTVGEPKTRIVGNMFDNSAGITVLELTSGLPPTALLLRNEGLVSP